MKTTSFKGRTMRKLLRWLNKSLWNCVSRMCRIGTNIPPMTLPILSTTDMSNLVTGQSVSVGQTPILERCGNCWFYDGQLCRSPFKGLPKRIRERLPKGVVLDRVPMKPEDGEGCNFWRSNDHLSQMQSGNSAS